MNRMSTPLLGCAVVLLRDRMGSLLPMGRSRIAVGRIEGGAVVAIQLSLIGIGLGIHRVGGIRLVAQQMLQQQPQLQSNHLQLDFDALHSMEIVAVTAAA